MLLNAFVLFLPTQILVFSIVKQVYLSELLQHIVSYLVVSLKIIKLRLLLTFGLLFLQDTLRVLAAVTWLLIEAG